MEAAVAHALETAASKRRPSGGLELSVLDASGAIRPPLRIELHREVDGMEQPQPEPHGFFAVSSARKDSAAWIFPTMASSRSEEHTSELQSRQYLVCRLLLEKKKDSQ